MTTPSAVSFHKVSFRYGTLEVLDDVCLEIPQHRVSCVVGPNGGGKSTLLKLILGIIKPHTGTIHIGGKSPEQAKLRIGYMPQHFPFDPQFPMSVRSIVQMGRINGNGPGFFNRRDRIVVDQVIAEMNLTPCRDSVFAELSGGQKQRVLIARALAVEPDLLLLDEPTAMVDAHSEAQLLARLRDLHQSMTVVMVSHDTSFVSNLVDQVICVNRHVEIHPTIRNDRSDVAKLYPDPVKVIDHRHDLAQHNHD